MVGVVVVSGQHGSDGLTMCHRSLSPLYATGAVQAGEVLCDPSNQHAGI